MAPDLKGLPVDHFATIVADPPWPYRSPGQIGKTLAHRPNRDKGMSKHGAGSVARYGAMTLDEIKALRVLRHAKQDTHLYLWFTNKFAVEAHEVARTWGFDPKTILTWTKMKANGIPSMKMGYYFRGATEHILFCVRGSLRLHADRALPTAYLWPRTAHSVKPDAFYDLVEEASPGPYLELFARREREGWATWGNDPAVNEEATNGQ